jgi:hypothetical protein
MKKTTIAGLALCMACAFVFLSCDSPTSDSEGGGLFSEGGLLYNGSGASGGKLTINSISGSLPSGTYQVYINFSSTEGSYKSSPSAVSKTVSSTASTVTISLYTSASSSTLWSGSGSYYIFIEDSSNGNLVAKSSQVSFTNGSAQISASSFTFSQSGQLSITGISSSLPSGTYQVYINTSSAEGSYKTSPSAVSKTASFTASTETISLYTSASSSTLWSGNGSYYIFIEDYSNGNLVAKSGQISFTYGSAQISASSLTFSQSVGKLSINGISNIQHGSYRVYINSSSNEGSYKSSPSAVNEYISFDEPTETISLYISTSSSTLWSGNDSYYIFIENSSSGNLVAKSGLVSFTKGSATISTSTLIPVAGSYFPWASVTSLSSSTLVNDSLTVDQVAWYSFYASGSSYSVQWDDSDNSANSCNIKVSAYESGGSPISENVDYGNTTSIPGGIYGTIYLKVQANSSYNATGTYGIQYY